MSSHHHFHWPTVVGIGLMVGLLLMEVQTHVLGNVGYVAIAGYALWLSKDRMQIYIITISASVLLIAGYVLAITLNPPSEQATFMVNRVSALVVIWFAQYFTIRYRMTQEHELRQRAELEEIKLGEERLKSSLKIYKAIAKNFPVGWIGILDENLNYVVADGKGLARVGLNAGEVTGKNFVSTLQADDGRPYLEEALGGKNVELEVRFKNRILEVLASPLPGIHKDKWILVVIHDITTLKETEAELIKALEKERTLGEMKSQFVTMASHEFRTPLTTILSSAHLLSNYSGDKLEKEKNTHVSRIKQSVKQLNDILGNFLFLQRLEEEGLRLNREAIDLPHVLSEIAIEAESLRHGTQTFVLRHTGGNSIVCDIQVLKTILNNLLSNAFKFSPADGQVTLEAVVQNGLVLFRISDNGMGILHDDQPHIFKKFFRGKNATNIQGTGLGLAIVQQHLQAMPESEISFSSEPGKKTVFTVSLKN